jgi:hypothetical protein
MRNIAVGVLSASLWASSFAQTSVGVSISVHQPGVYGRIELGNLPPPRVIYAQPVVIVQSPMAQFRRPIYLYVPPGHQKDWSKHCSRYNACGQPVYFVQEDWIQERYDAREDRGNQGQGKSKKPKKARDK